MLKEEIKAYLEKLDQEQVSLVSCDGEYGIASTIQDIIEKDTNYTPSFEDKAEYTAFGFMAEYPDDDSGWGTYYGPMSILPNKQGQMVERPSIRGVDEKTLKYWAKRANDTKNPILSSRYADLVVDFSRQVVKQNADIGLFQKVIDSNIAICEELLADSLDCKTKIKRALILAIQINNQEKINRVKEAIINLEKKVESDDKPGLWGFAFKWLMLDFDRKITLGEVERVGLIKDLEDRLKRIEQNEWLTEKAVSLLAEHYAKEQDEDNLMRVLGVLEKSLKMSERINSSILLKVDAYERMCEIYRKYGGDKGFQKANVASKRILQEIGQFDLNPNKSLKEISVTAEIKQKEIDDFLEKIFGDKGQDELKTFISKIVLIFLPKKETMKRQFKDISSECLIPFLCTTQVISDDGIPIAKLSGLDKNYDEHFRRHALQYMQLMSVFLAPTLDELRKRISKQNITEHFRNATLFDNEEKEYLEQALSAYWDNDYRVSSHLFIPLIESAIRELIRKNGGDFLKENDSDGYNRRTLSRLLDKEEGDIVENVFSDIGQDMVFYLRLVLIDKLGMNLRNDFAHGFGKKKFSSREVSDRLFHIMLCLSLVSKQEEKE